MRYLGETGVTQVGEIRQGADGQFYQWIEGVDGLGNPMGWWKRLLRKAIPLAQRIAPFVPGGAAALKVAEPILQEAGLLGDYGLGALYEGPDGSLYQLQGLDQDEELQGTGEEGLMGLGYIGEVRQDLEGNLYQWVEGVDGLGNPVGFWQCCPPWRGRRFLPGTLASRPGVPPRLLRRRRMMPPGGFYGSGLDADEAELEGLSAEEELAGFSQDELEGLAEDEELQGLAAEEELMGLAEDDELQGLAEDEELLALSEEDELQGLDQAYIPDPAMSGLEAYVPERPPSTPGFTPAAQAPRKRHLMWDPLW